MIQIDWIFMQSTISINDCGLRPDLEATEVMEVASYGL